MFRVGGLLLLGTVYGWAVDEIQTTQTGIAMLSVLFPAFALSPKLLRHAGLAASTAIFLFVLSWGIGNPAPPLIVAGVGFGWWAGSLPAAVIGTLIGFQAGFVFELVWFSRRDTWIGSPVPLIVATALGYLWGRITLQEVAPQTRRPVAPGPNAGSNKAPSASSESTPQ